MDINHSLFVAVRKGKLQKVIQLINSSGLFRSEGHGYVLLCTAIKYKHLEIAKQLLISGSKVNNRKKNPTDTPLHLAVRNGNIEIIKMLLDRGANVNAKNEDDITPLHNAIENPKMEIIDQLLKRQAYINSPFTLAWRESYTPLYLTAEKDSVEIVKILLNKGAKVDAAEKNGITPLHIATVRGYPQIVDHLLKHGANVNCAYTSTWREGYTPLHLAAEQGNEEILKILLNKGAKVDTEDKNGITPLHIATGKGCLQFILHFLNYGYSVNSKSTPKSWEGDTPLHLATKMRKPEVVKLLLEHGANVNTQNKNSESILAIAVDKRCLSTIDEILKYGPDINNKSNRSAFYKTICGSEYSQILEKLLQYGFSVNREDANNCELMYKAIEKGYLKIVEDLLKYCTDVNIPYSPESSKTLLHHAIKFKQEKVAELLIKCGADVNSKVGKPPLLNAVKNNDFKIAKLLLQHGADINTSDYFGRTALHFTSVSEHERFPGYDELSYERFVSCEENNGEIAKLLLTNGADVDAQTNEGITTLHVAAQNGYIKVVEALLEYNANVNPSNCDYTPLHSSALAKNDNKEIAIMLLNKGANVNAKLKNGHTALNIAIEKRNPHLVEVLLYYDAKINCNDEINCTLLHQCAEQGNCTCIELLLKFGADVDTRDDYGRTALHIAVGEGEEEVVETLLNYGSDINALSINNKIPIEGAFDKIDNVKWYDNCDDICLYGSIVRTLRLQIIKMKIANLYVSEKNLQALTYRREEYIGDFEDECKQELESMKCEKIGSVSFYDILTKNRNKLAKYAKNKNVVEVLKSDDYVDNFPNYASIIKNNFKTGMERNELLDQINQFNILFELPYICTEKIFSYLNNNDLRHVICLTPVSGVQKSFKRLVPVIHHSCLFNFCKFCD